MSALSDIVRARLEPGNLVLHDWLYEFTREPKLGVLLIGSMVYIASKHQDWNFWQVLGEAKATMPVIDAKQVQS